jgi:hypothetical protein
MGNDTGRTRAIPTSRPTPGTAAHAFAIRPDQ